MISEQQIENKLNELGIPRNYTGYGQIKQVVMELQKNPYQTLSNICRTLGYDQRSLSKSMERAYSRAEGDPKKIKYYFGDCPGIFGKIKSFYLRLIDEANRIKYVTRDEVEEIIHQYLKERL